MTTRPLRFGAAGNCSMGVLAGSGEGYRLIAAPWITRPGTVTFDRSPRRSVLPHAVRHANDAALPARPAIRGGCVGECLD
jgi:hypothetical protein